MASLGAILLDFDAIAGQLVSFSNDLVWDWLWLSSAWDRMVVAQPDNGPVHVRNGGYRTMSYGLNRLGAGIGGPEDQQILCTAKSEGARS
jgi:hypothetical protein